MSRGWIRIVTTEKHIKMDDGCGCISIDWEDWEAVMDAVQSGCYGKGELVLKTDVQI